MERALGITFGMYGFLGKRELVVIIVIGTLAITSHADLAEGVFQPIDGALRDGT
jgi:hypothetical protein